MIETTPPLLQSRLKKRGPPGSNHADQIELDPRANVMAISLELASPTFNHTEFKDRSSLKQGENLLERAFVERAAGSMV